MRLSHVVLAIAALLPLSSQAITIDKLGGHWVNTDVTCKPNPKEFVFCEIMIKPANKSVAEMYLMYKGKMAKKSFLLTPEDTDTWTISLEGEALSALEYEDGMLYDEDGNKYYRVSK